MDRCRQQVEHRRLTRGIIQFTPLQFTRHLNRSLIRQVIPPLISRLLKPTSNPPTHRIDIHHHRLPRLPDRPLPKITQPQRIRDRPTPYPYNTILATTQPQRRDIVPTDRITRVRPLYFSIAVANSPNHLRPQSPRLPIRLQYRCPPSYQPFKPIPLQDFRVTIFCHHETSDNFNTCEQHEEAPRLAQGNTHRSLHTGKTEGKDSKCPKSDNSQRSTLEEPSPT